MTCPALLSKLRTAPSTVRAGTSSHAPGHQEWAHSTASALEGQPGKGCGTHPGRPQGLRVREDTKQAARVSSGPNLKAIVLHSHASQGGVAASGSSLPPVLPLLGGPSGRDRCLLLHYPSSSQVSQHHQRPGPGAEAASPRPAESLGSARASHDSAPSHLRTGRPCPPAQRQDRGSLTSVAEPAGPATHLQPGRARALGASGLAAGGGTAQLRTRGAGGRALPELL